MLLTEKQIQKYRDIYKEIYGKEISQEKASEEATKLYLLVKLVCSGCNNNKN